MASSSTSVVLPNMSVVPPNNAHGEKPKKFTGVDFKRWQQKMLFYLTTLNLVKILKEDAPTVEEKETDSQKRAAFDAWSHSDFLCRNYILNCLDNTLYNVVAIIEKLPPMWKDFKNYLKRKRKEMGLENLIVRLGIEENRNAEKKFGKQQMEVKVNLVEPNTIKKRKHPNNSKQKSKAKKFKGDCYNCGKPAHIAKDCREKKQNKKDQVHLTEEDRLSNKVSELMLSAVVFEANMVDNPREWFVDTGATRHVCADKEMFSSYNPINGRQLFMGNSATSKVISLGKLVLKMTSWK
ncbi:uncharacterized protein LOC111400757 [Olea europaea var. sylvestris]|uniref:uncharacterized protein LOC111400757 n=1 Tax=Olea europaea var. sylvestris TaxID=158386 RepID=UPI000C1CD350|nr:uncharacterized protein LOC111400757 [Olea europaea var. sylvestris]